jgi:Xaa-Pro aminopeptidase
MATRIFATRQLVALALALALLPLTAAPAAAGGAYDPVFPKEEFAERRARFVEQAGDGIAIFLGALPRADYSQFRQNNTFYYFTGIETPGAVLVLDGTRKQATLYVPRFGEGEILASGPQLEPGAAAVELTGLDRVQPLDELAPSLLAGLTFRALFGTAPKVYVSTLPEELPGPDQAVMHFLAAQLPWDGRLSREMQLVRWLRERQPLVEIVSHDPIVHALRRVKTPREIEKMREAGRLTAAAANEAIRATRPGRFEYQVSAVAEFVMKNGGARDLAFHNIVASGANANIWHYSANDAELKAGDLVLMDAGAEYDYYAGDITRTWPVGGRFTPEQERLYRAVLAARAKTIAAVKPGVTVEELRKTAHAVFEEHGVAEHAARGIGHMVGMAVHDIGSPTEPFVPGVVFNVEPILDLPEQGVHVRLEDTVLVTEEGHEVLTAASPVEIEEIYRLYDEGSRLVE